MKTAQRTLRRSRRAGMTLLEVMMSMIVLLVAVGGMLGSFSSFAMLGEASRQKTVALLAAQQMLEQMQLADFSEVYVRFNGTNADDPALGLSPGPNFDVFGLSPQLDDPDGLPGRVVFPSAAGVLGSLREDLAEADFGLPRDLNGDGNLDANNHAGDYQILPIRIVIEWGGSSPNSLELQTALRSNQW